MKPGRTELASANLDHLLKLSFILSAAAERRNEGTAVPLNSLEQSWKRTRALHRAILSELRSGQVRAPNARTIQTPVRDMYYSRDVSVRRHCPDYKSAPPLPCLWTAFDPNPTSSLGRLPSPLQSTLATRTLSNTLHNKNAAKTWTEANGDVPPDAQCGQGAQEPRRVEASTPDTLPRLMLTCAVQFSSCLSKSFSRSSPTSPITGTSSVKIIMAEYRI